MWNIRIWPSPGIPLLLVHSSPLCLYGAHRRQWFQGKLSLYTVRLYFAKTNKLTNIGSVSSCVCYGDRWMWFDWSVICCKTSIAVISFYDVQVLHKTSSYLASNYNGRIVLCLHFHYVRFYSAKLDHLLEKCDFKMDIYWFCKICRLGFICLNYKGTGLHNEIFPEHFLCLWQIKQK